MATPTTNPRDESNGLLNAAITMAMRLLERHGSHIPFAIVIDHDGKQSNIAADDTETQDRAILERTVLDQLREMCERRELRAIAFARNTSFRRSPDGPSIHAVEVNLDHLDDSAVTCILPYELHGHVVQPAELFAIDPRVSFFAADGMGK